MAKHHSDEQKARIVAQYYAHLKAGKSAPVAAKKMGVSYQTLRRWINAGINPPKAKSKSSERLTSGGPLHSMMAATKLAVANARRGLAYDLSVS